MSRNMSLDENGHSLRRDIYPMTRFLMLRFEWKIFKGGVSPPVKGFYLFLVFDQVRN